MTLDSEDDQRREPDGLNRTVCPQQVDSGFGPRWRFNVLQTDDHDAFEASII
jgi:hypothetical protein